MFDVATGELKFETRFEQFADVDITGINVRLLGGRILVSVNTKPQQDDFVDQDGDVRVTFQRMHRGNALLSGSLVLLDSETGEAIWDRPVMVQRFQLLDGIPWDSPFLFLTRRNVYESDVTTEVRVQLAMIDTDSGKLKVNELLKVPLRDDAFNQVICQPRFGNSESQVIDLQIATLDTRFYLGSLQTPPQPVATLVNRSSFRQMKKEVEIVPEVSPTVTDLQALIDKAAEAEVLRIEQGKEEQRLNEIEMKSN